MRPEERAARERKQKIFVVIGGLFLVALLAIQLPKLLGGSSSPEAAGTETTSTVPGQVTATPPGTVTPPAGTTTPAAQASTVAATTKLSSFSAFRPKDPFVQQVVTDSGIEGASGSSAPAGTEPKSAKDAKGEGSTEKFSVGAKAAVSSTIVTVNGERQVVEPGSRFPAADPLFVLVAEKPQAKAVVIGVVGGAYSGGGKTTTLKVGKSLTLVNTTTGARYKISLVSVGSGGQTPQPAPQAGN